MPASDLYELAIAGMILYGQKRNREAIPSLACLYKAIVQTHDANQRLQAQQIITNVIIRDQTSVVALLPALVCDPDLSVASSAALEMLAGSELMEDGTPYALAELDPLLRDRAPANIGAVFGGMVSFGDSRVRPTLDATKVYLTREELGTAARCTTGLLNVATLDFWLSWAEELVCDPADESQGRLGRAASALANQITDDRMGLVREIRRNFPAQRSDKPIETLRTWSLSEYGLELAPRLYRLEELETTPKIFPFILQKLSLTPKSATSAWADIPQLA